MILSPLSEVRRKQACPNHLTFICSKLLSDVVCNGSTVSFRSGPIRLRWRRDVGDGSRPEAATGLPQSCR